MRWYKAQYKLKSWVASAWQSDTIFGHLCWGMLYLYGENKLKEFLESYEKATPPLLLSNGFPCDLLPLPLTAPPATDTTLSIADQREQFKQHKETRKGRYVTKDDFTRALKGEAVIPVSETGEIRRITLKNQLNRLTSTTGEEGQLYNFEEYHWPEVTIYLKVADSFTNTAEQLLHYLANSGYGKRKSIGYGEIESMNFEPSQGFEHPQNANAFVTLSNFVPAKDDPTQGYWHTTVKYGKMGEERASEDHAFKKPLIMLEAGSTLYDHPCHEYYGHMVTDLSFYADAVQYAFALPVPMVLPQPVI